MSDPEPDDIFRARLLRVVGDKDRRLAEVACGPHLDILARRYDRFRAGAPPRSFEIWPDQSALFTASWTKL